MSIQNWESPTKKLLNHLTKQIHKKHPHACGEDVGDVIIIAQGCEFLGEKYAI